MGRDSCKKMCSKLALNGLKTEERLLVNCWGKIFTCPEESVTNLGSEQTLGRKGQCAQDRGLAAGSCGACKATICSGSANQNSHGATAGLLTSESVV